MKKLTPYLLVFFALISFLTPSKVWASHAAGAELTYTWVSDSTYDFTYHFYRDCSGIPEPDSVEMCWFDSCDGTSGSIWLHKTLTIRGGAANGSEVLPGCDTNYTTCRGGTTPGYREWWYTGRMTLTGTCRKWRFSHSESARNGSVLNIVGGNLYVEATLNNKDDQGNSSAYFTVVPVPYMCINNPYTYNNGAFDPNGDSLYFENIHPETANTTCFSYPSDDAWSTGTSETYSIPSNPLACGGTFSFSHVTGQMTFTPDLTGMYVVTVRVLEFKKIGGVWTEVGSVMRDIQVVVLNCDVPSPTLNTVTSTLSGATMTSGIVNACATIPFSFCFDATTTDSAGVLVVRDNHAAFTASGSSSVSVTYTGMFGDSVRGCLTWTPGLKDTGLKVFTVTVIDSSCRDVVVPISQTFVIPIYVWPVTKILSDTTICPGDSVGLTAIGGGGFVWDVLPGGSGSSSMSTTAGANIKVWPTTTTRYTVHSTKNLYCAKNRDTITVKVVPAPYGATYDTAACVGATIQLSVPVTTPDTGISTDIKWSPSTYLSNTTTNNPYCAPLSTMAYYVSIKYAGIAKCQTVDTVNVKALTLFQLLTTDTSVCKNQPLAVNATGDPSFTYTWTPTAGVSDPSSLTPIITPDTTRTYTVTSHHVACPDTSESFTVSVQPTPLVSLGPDKVTCAGDTVHLFATVNPAGFTYTYQWLPDTSVSNPHSTSTTFIGTVNTTLVFNATTAGGCTGSDTIVVDVIPAHFLQVSPDTGICPGDTAHLRALGDSIVSVMWSPSIFINDSVSFTPNVWPNVSQTYHVYAVNMRNCKDTESVHVTVHPAAVINLPDSVLIYPGDSYQLAPEGNCLYYSWFPPLGLSATNISDPVAKPDVDTRYIVNGQTEAGCKIQDTINVYVSYDSYINVPNGFTPGSGPDNILKVQHLGDATLKSFTIYNRWGVKVFETSDINVGWDGTYNGQPQPMGVYVYMVEAYTAKGKRVFKQGNVTLLR